MLLRLMRWINRLNRGVGQLAAWLCLAMVALGTWNVVGRYLGRTLGHNLSSNTLIEGQWYLFDLVFLLGAAYTLQQDEFVRVDPLYTRWGPKGQALANLLGTVLFLMPFCAVILFYSWDVVVSSWINREMSPDPGGLPRYPIKAMILVSFGLLLLQGVADVIKNGAILTGRLRVEAIAPPPLAQSGVPSLSQLPPRSLNFDVAPDVVPDAVTDAAIDAVTDTAIDAVTDTAIEAVPDAMTDTLTDSSTDSVTDAVPDSLTDSLTDAMTDSVTDRPSEGEPQP